jgi:hypothetical protein
MKKMLILLSHQLNDDQLKDLASLGFDPVFMTDDQKKVWSQIQPDTLVDSVNGILAGHTFDDVLVQGHFGAVGHVLKTVGFDHCWYAHSVRMSVDSIQADGSVVKTAVFKHAGFFKY